MLVLLFLYGGYIALSNAAAREGGSYKIAAIFGLVGAINVPIINRSVVWWNSLHQPPSLTAGKSAIDGVFLWPLLIGVLGFSLPDDLQKGVSSDALRRYWTETLTTATAARSIAALGAPVST